MTPMALAAGGPEKPALVVVIVVDQLSVELFERLDPVYKDGFRRFRRDGIRFTQARHDHALTQTAPGHFVIMSGRHPGRGRVLANEFYDRERRKTVYAVDDDEAEVIGSNAKGVSYRNVESDALGDWMKAADTRSLVFAVAGKDRSAILLGGRKPDGVFWFDAKASGFTTSTYYADTLPAFVIDFNARDNARKYFGARWERVLKDEKSYQTHAGPDDDPGENTLSDAETAPVFPHVLPEFDDVDSYNRFKAFPWMDDLTLKLASRTLKEIPFGADDAPDLLCVSLSAFDALGHTFGPHSQEAMDAAIRIDRALGEFLREIERRLGQKKVVMVLTADHGILPLVERLRSNGVESERASGAVKEFRESLLEELEKKYGDARALFLFRGQENLHFDHKELEKRGISRDELYETVRHAASRAAWISRVFDRNQLQSAEPLDTVGEMMRHSFHPKAGADVYLIPKAFHLTAGMRRGTNHGTPHDYDCRVPVVFIVTGAKPAQVDRAMRTVDLAPTLAKLLGFSAPADVDGVALPEIIGK